MIVFLFCEPNYFKKYGGVSYSLQFSGQFEAHPYTMGGVRVGRGLVLKIEIGLFFKGGCYFIDVEDIWVLFLLYLA